MSLELIDKEVSTEDLDTDNVEKKENQEQSTKEKEKKEATDLEKLEAVLSVLVENKVTSIRNCGGSKVKEKNLLFSRFRSKVDEGENGKSENKSHKTRNNSSTTVTSGCKCGCHHRNHSRCRSLVPCETSGHCHGSQGLSQPPSKPMYPQQSFGSYDHSLFYKADDGLCWERKTDLDHRMDRRKFPVQKCLPKQLSTEQWLNSTTSRQTSTETATTSSGYISPTFGTESKRHRSPLLETIEPNQIRDSVEAGSNGDSETIIDMSKFQAQKSLDAIEESKSKDDILLTEPQQFRAVSELEHLKINNNKSLKSSTFKYNESCHQLLPQCVSTTCLPTCRCPAVGDRSCQNGAPYRHLHPSGGHYMSCYNSPAHSCQRFQYDENYLTLVMNLEDLEFEQEEERRKRRKRRKKRRKERQIRARGLMADELKSVKNATKVLDPEDLPKRARWTIVATACLLILMSMLLVGVTLRMAPIIDEMVRKENEEMLNSLSRQGAIKEATTAATTTTTTVLTQLNATGASSSLGNFSGRL